MASLLAAVSRMSGVTSDKEWRRLTTLTALCVLSMIRGADQQLLPASFRAMEVDLQLRPAALAGLALCQGVSCALAGPLWGNLVDSGVSRKLLLNVGVGLWGLCTLLLAFAVDFAMMAGLRVLNGAALAMLLPVIQSFVVDLTPRSKRGYTFGWLFFFANLGQVLACLFVTPLSNSDVAGTDGWRVALAAVGVLSATAMFLVPLMVVEEPRPWRPDRLGPGRELRKLGQFLRIPTFTVIILQGVFGTIPGAAQSFTTMYFQYSGVSDARCALMNSLRIVGDAFGGVLGGMVGDMLSARSPSYGRAMTAQISVVAAVPLVYMIFLAPHHGPTEASLAASAGFLFLHGLVASWVAPGCICPTMCDIVPKRALASAYAWELALVFCSGNTIGPLLVGLLSQRFFGYQLSTEQVEQMSVEARARNADALGKAVFWSSALPYSVCALLFTLLYFTYSRDVRAASESDDSDTSTGGPTETSPLQPAAEPLALPAAAGGPWRVPAAAA